MDLKSFLVLFVQVIVVFGQSPGCQLTDSRCLIARGQATIPEIVGGLPELGGEKLDPMRVNAIGVDLAGLKLDLKNADITGLHGAIINKISVDPSKKLIKLVYHADYVLKSKYKASGQLLILPINGDGEAEMRLKNCQIAMDIVYDMGKNQNGQDIIDLKSYKYNYDVKEHAVYRLTNLFNGNKALSDAMHTFMNDNWKTMIVEFGRPIFDHPVQKVFNNIKLYLTTQPVNA